MTTLPRATLLLLAGVLVPACGGGGGGGAPAARVPETAVVALAGNALVTHAASAPGQTLATVQIKGAAGRLVGLDYRPGYGALFAVSDAGRLYRIDPASGAATSVGTAFAVPLSGGAFAADVDPASDLLRVGSDAGQNLRVHPATGAASADPALRYAPGDPHAGADPDVVALAYTASGTLYGIDVAGDRLVRVAADGALATVGSLGLDAGAASLDIAGENAAYATLKSGDRTRLYSVDLRTGAATALGVLGPGDDVQGMSIASLPPFAPAPGSLVVLKGDNLLLNHSAARPDRIAGVLAVGGVAGSLVAVAYHPAAGTLYGLSDADRLYAIDPVSGSATPVGGTFGAPLPGTAFGLDVDPAAGHARILSDAGANRRVDLAGGAAFADGALAYAVGDVHAGRSPRAAALARSAGSLYAIDTELDVLAALTLPGAGQLNTIGGLGVNATAASFDVSGGTALAALETGGQTRLYAIHLSTGAATLLGTLGDGGPVLGFAVKP